MAINLLSLTIWLAILVNMAFASNLAPRQSCSKGYTLCSPPGATGSNTYGIDNGLDMLYSNILDTVNPQPPAPEISPQPANPNGPAKRQDFNTMCCVSGLSCLLLLNANVPICYDKFTTDFALSNGDYGTVSNGTFITSSSARVNLISGNYTVPNGQTGNIYSSVPSDKPNTATLPIPTQFTSSGVGSAVPASQLGSSASYRSSRPVFITAATTLPGTVASSDVSLSGPAVIPCSTCCNDCGLPSTTVNANIPTTISLSSVSGTSTVPGSVAGTKNATITIPVTASAGNKLRFVLKGVELGVWIGAITAVFLWKVVLSSRY